MEHVEITEGWEVRFSAPVLEIADADGNIRFHTNQWNPNMSDPRADALYWASAVADPDSGLTAEDADDPVFALQVRDVRRLAPSMFADLCEIEAGNCETVEA